MPKTIDKTHAARNRAYRRRIKDKLDLLFNDPPKHIQDALLNPDVHRVFERTESGGLRLNWNMPGSSREIVEPWAIENGLTWEEYLDELSRRVLIKARAADQRR